MPFVITTPTPTDTEDLTLDGLSLNNNILGLESLSCPPPRQRQEWIGAADSEHQALVRDPLYDNRKVTATINVIPSGDMDAALDRIGEIRDKLAAASKAQDGIELTWSPATSTRTVTFDVLSGEIVEMPVDWENGWLAKAPQVTVEMTCKPFWRGEEVLTAITSSSTPIVTAELVNNSGDVPALGRLVVTNLSGEPCRHLEWGLEGPLTYNPATSLFLDSDSLVTAGFSGAQATITGAYDPNAAGTNAVSVTARTVPIQLAGTGNLSHVGAFRVKARVYSNQVTGGMFRLVWRAADGPMSTNAWASHRGSLTWEEHDLGMITVPTATAGTQRWTGYIEVKTTTGTATVAVDYLELIPVSDGYGKARAVFAYRPGIMAGYDDFTGTTAGSGLNGRVGPLGGTWSSSGAATDLVFSDDFGTEQLKRSATGTRDAVPGTTWYGDVDTSIRFRFADTGPSLSLRGRVVDANNYLDALLQTGLYAGFDVLILEAQVASSAVLSSPIFFPPLAPGFWYRLRLLAWQATGYAVAALYTDGGSLIAHATGWHTSLKTAGTLATGNVGFSEGASTTITRYYDDFYVGAPMPEPILIHPGRTLEVTSSDVLRQDASGTYYGRPQSYRGSRCLVPVGTSRVLVKARRNDVDSAADGNVTDATQVQIGITARGLVVPRS